MGIASQPLRLQFTCPGNTSIAGLALSQLINAVVQSDDVLLAAMRARFNGEAAGDFDRFVASLGRVIDGDHAGAAGGFAQIGTREWQAAAMVFQAIAIAGAGDLGQGFAIANRARDAVETDRLSGAANFAGDKALVAAGLQVIIALEAAYDPSAGPVRGPPPFRYLISYPRSGNSMLRQFLSFAFAAPRYSVYPGDGRYFSRRFHDPAPGHAVFVKDHHWRDDYANDESLALVRDGRNVIISLARFLYVQGRTRLVRRGELADFISHIAADPEFGFWGDHTRRILEARDRGARVQILRYEELVRNYRRLQGLAQELARGGPAPLDDEVRYAAFVDERKRVLARHWRQSVKPPADSFIPENWSVGGETIDWQAAFDAPARRRFHELGGTDMLMRLGYEADADWVRGG
jgi:hypothetical protein